MTSIRADASRSSLPNAWVKAPARSFQPRSAMAARISPRAAAQLCTRSSAPRWPASATARSSATPAHQLGVEQVAGLAADFPDALVLFPPPADGGVGGGGEELPGDRVELAELVDQQLGGAEQLAVDVKLPPPPRAVADPDRAAVPPPGQVRQFPFGQVPLAADAEHDLQVRSVLQLGGGGVGEEGEELAGLMRAGRHPQDSHGEAGRIGCIDVVWVAHLSSSVRLSADAMVEMEAAFDELEPELRAQAAGQLRGRGADWQFQRRQGLIADELIAVAAGLRDARPGQGVVIVIGSSSHATHRMAGSVAVSRARHAPVPLVIVP